MPPPPPTGNKGGGGGGQKKEEHPQPTPRQLDHYVRAASFAAEIDDGAWTRAGDEEVTRRALSACVGGTCHPSGGGAI